MSYGKNFEFRVAPESADRSGRYYLDSATAVVIGAPVVLTATGENDLGLAPVDIASEAAATPLPGQGGVLVYETIQYIGDDPSLTTYSDKDTAPAGAAVQVVGGREVKIVLRNTSDTTFLNTRSYTGRTMVAGLGATPTLEVGDMLTPGVGDGTSGYWKETADVTKAWAVITKVDADRGEVEARLTF
jgi:hypothetical protein